MEPVDLFYSYAHEDEKLRDELDGHLALLRRKGVIRPGTIAASSPGSNGMRRSTGSSARQT